MSLLWGWREGGVGLRLPPSSLQGLGGEGGAGREVLLPYECAWVMRVRLWALRSCEHVGVHVCPCPLAPLGPLGAGAGMPLWPVSVLWSTRVCPCFQVQARGSLREDSGEPLPGTGSPSPLV